MSIFLLKVSKRLADLERKVANIVRLGTVAQVDTEKALVRVSIPPLLSAWIPWMTQRAGNIRTWNAPSVGEQVAVIAPSGDLTQGFALPAIYQTAFPAPASNAAEHLTQYPDGAVISYDHEAHKLKASIPGTAELTTDGDLKATCGGSLKATASGSADINASDIKLTAPSVTIDSPKVSMTGLLTVTTDATIGGKSFIGHIHGGKPPSNENEKTTPPVA